MKKIMTVIRKEYLERVRSKSFVIGTLLGPALMSMFIVLPMLSDRAHKIVSQCADEEESKKLVDVIVPTSFNFPNVGKLMTLTFVPFAGWFTGFLVPQGQMPSFLVSGLLVYITGGLESPFTFFFVLPIA